MMYYGSMRTTVKLEPDVAAAVEQERRQRGAGLSDAVNALIRRALAASPATPRFEQRTHDLGLRIDVTNIGEALETLEGSDHS